MRVALFTDSFTEANGVATVSREFAAYALRHGVPFFCIHGGPRTRLTRNRSQSEMELKRGFASFRLDHDLFCDPLLSRYRNRVLAAIRPFKPDLVHITGPGDIGVLGFWIAHLLQVPLVASWHTNLHEYAARRLEKGLSFIPLKPRRKLSLLAEQKSLRACMWFYGYARFSLAPNQPMVDLLHEQIGRPAFLMGHGVDTMEFSPRQGKRAAGPFRIGYVGRLSPEKNVRMIADLEHTLIACGKRDFRFCLVGDGDEKTWLKNHLQFADFPGVMRGKQLSELFTAMDAFVFPSRTDTFGLVLLEAMSSGVPVIAGPETARRVGIENGVTGFHARDVSDFAQGIIRLMEDDDLRISMSRAARVFACSKSWDGVFDHVYRTYQTGLEMIGKRKPQPVEEIVA